MRHMRTILDQGKAGAELLGDYRGPAEKRLDAAAEVLITRTKSLKPVSLEVEVADGLKRTITVRGLPLAWPRVFQHVRELAAYGPLVYASQNGRRAQLGMLSPNYDTAGTYRL